MLRWRFTGNRVWHEGHPVIKPPATILLDLSNATWTAVTAAYHVSGEDAAEVRAYLGEHPDLPDLLLEIREAVRRYFGNDPMSLKLFLDPEWEDAEPELLAVVKTRHRDALARLKVFDNEWWFAKLTANGPAVVVTFDILPHG